MRFSSFKKKLMHQLASHHVESDGKQPSKDTMASYISKCCYEAQSGVIGGWKRSKIVSYENSVDVVRSVNVPEPNLSDLEQEAIKLFAVNENTDEVDNGELDKEMEGAVLV